MDGFAAGAVAAEKISELNAFVVVFAENSDGSGSTLQLQLALGFDDQDRAAGEDTYCLVLDGGPTHYGGVTEYALADNAVTFFFDADAQSALDVDEGIRIGITSRSLAQRDLEGGLRRVLGFGAVRWEPDG